MRSRIVILFTLLVGLWSAMILRAAFLQIFPNQRLSSLQKRQFEGSVTLSSRRGDVLDRRGQELAISTTAYSLFADPKLIEDPHRTARVLAKKFNLPYRAVLDKLKRKKSRFVWIQRQTSRNDRDEIVAKKIKGLGFIEESKRTYPNEKLLAHALGFVGSEGNGLEGLEAQYNDRLAANKKKVSIQRDARGRPLLIGGQLLTEAPPGADVQLTIDRDLQYILEQELHAAVSAHRADSAVGVVLDAQTAEVLALASAPAFDPNRPSDFPADRRRNKAVTDAFEPGSTMKTFVIASAIERGKLEPNSKIDCEGGMMKIGKRIIREADAKHKFNILTATEVLAYSSNIGVSKIAFKLGDQALLEDLKKFGFGERSGVDLPGEARGIMQSLPWKDHLLANISFGHGLTATPLQIAAGYAAIANGGWLKQPYIVRKIQDNETGEVIEVQPQVRRQVMRPEVAAKLRLMLNAVTGPEGTGENAKVAGFPVAGKTGTAQKVNSVGRGYLANAYISSFAGFLPANEPKFVIYIAVDNPRKGYYGSQVAAPVFSRVASFAVRHAGLAPVLISENDLMSGSKASVFANKEISKEKSAKIAVAKDASAKAASEGSVGASSASENIAMAAGAKNGSNDSTNASAVNEPSASAAATPISIGSLDRLPDLTGLSLREVVRRLNGTGLKVQAQGEGVVRRSWPAAGTDLASRKSVTVFLEETR